MTATSDPPYVPLPTEACTEAAYRLNVVLRLLGDHNCKDGDDDGTAEGGYDLSIMRDALEAIRNLLTASVKRDEAERRTEVQ
jgi:hypothetical protein